MGAGQRTHQTVTQTREVSLGTYKLHSREDGWKGMTLPKDLDGLPFPNDPETEYNPRLIIPERGDAYLEIHPITED